jgi:hypothetical protein
MPMKYSRRRDGLCRCIFKVDKSGRVIIYGVQLALIIMPRVLVFICLRRLLYERDFNAVASSPTTPPKTSTGRRRRPKSQNTASQNSTVFLELESDMKSKTARISSVYGGGKTGFGSGKFNTVPTLRRGERGRSASRTRPRLRLPS